MKIKFDDPTIRNLKPTVNTFDCKAEGERGFGIRIHPSGTMTFFYQYKIDGLRRFMSLGNYPTTTLKMARELYQAELAKVKALRRGSADGADPAAEKKRKKEQRVAEDIIRSQALTVGELITEYIEKHAIPNKRGWAEDKRILEHDALPSWGKRKAQDITKRDIVLLLEKIIERGSPGSANNNFKIIRKMFNYAVDKDIIKITPCARVKMPAEEVRKDRCLSEDEIRTFWHNLATCHVSDDLRRALKLILVTGQRPGEIIGMHTNEITNNWWTIPAERAKNKLAHHVFLTSTALELIGPLKILDTKTNKMKPKGFIFACRHAGKIKPIGNSVPAQVIRRNMAVPVKHNRMIVYDSDGKPCTENKLGVSDFTPHDLRRTCATFMSKIGFKDEIIDAVLSHVKKGIIRTYNMNLYDKEKKAALEAWERKLNSIITGSKYIDSESADSEKQQSLEARERDLEAREKALIARESKNENKGSKIIDINRILRNRK